MPEVEPRRLVVDGVRASALMQVATIGDGGFPAVCPVWFHSGFEPDRLYFVSRQDREHAINLRGDPRVAASIALEVPAGLGDRVRGVTLTGLAREIPDLDQPALAAAFVARWPRAAGLLAPVRSLVTAPVGAAAIEVPRSRLYEIAVVDWVLFDEVNFPEQPRRAVPAH